MNPDQNQREQTLQEYIISKADEIPSSIQYELDVLLWCREHPLQEFWIQKTRRFWDWWWRVTGR